MTLRKGKNVKDVDKYQSHNFCYWDPTMSEDYDPKNTPTNRINVNGKVIHLGQEQRKQAFSQVEKVRNTKR